MIEFAIYCSGHRKNMIENRFEEFERLRDEAISQIGHDMM